MTIPTLHLEAFRDHPIARWVRPMSTWRCAPWPSTADGVWGQVGKSGLASQGAATVVDEKRCTDAAQRGRHWVWADNYFMDPTLASKWQPGDPNAVKGPTPEQLAIGVFRKTLPSSKLCELLEPAASLVRKFGFARDGLNYIDAEPGLNSDNRDKPEWKAAWNLLATLCRGASTDELDREIREAVYLQLQACCRVLGLAPETLLVFGCADRPVTPEPGMRPSLPLRIPVALSYLWACTEHPGECDKLESDLNGGSGPTTAVVTLSSQASPAQNARLLDLCASLEVPHVILFADGSVPGNDNATVAEQRAMAVRRLDEHLPVFRDFFEG